MKSRLLKMGALTTLIAAGIVGMLSGCGSSAAPAAPAAAAMTLVSSTPADGATNVPLTVAPEISFSLDLDSAAATSTNVTLTNTDGLVPASLAAAGPKLTVTPSKPLSPMTTYYVQLGSGLSGTNGAKLANARTLSFKTGSGDRAWHAAQLIETGGGQAFTPHIAIDSSGNAIAVWHQRGSSIGSDIYASRYVAGTGWGVAQLIETGSGDAVTPQVAFDASGNAIAVWAQDNGINYGIYASRYVAGTGWGTAQRIETGSGDALQPQINFDASGNAIAVWAQKDGVNYGIYANRYVAGTGWGTAQRIETSSGYANGPQIAVDAGGNAIAVWAQNDGAANSIYANRYAAGKGWGTAQLIEADTSNAAKPQIAIDAWGNAIAVWEQNDPNIGTVISSIYTNRYVAGIGWGTAQLLETGSGQAAQPQIAIDTKGNAFAVWAQNDGVTDGIYAKHYVAGTGWGVVQRIGTGNIGTYKPQLAFDSSGNAIAVWEQDDLGTYGIYANRCVAGTGWGTAERIGTGNGPSSFISQNSIDASGSTPQIAVDASGNAIVAWLQHNGTANDVVAARFD